MDLRVHVRNPCQDPDLAALQNLDVVVAAVVSRPQQVGVPVDHDETLPLVDGEEVAVLEEVNLAPVSRRRRGGLLGVGEGVTEEVHSPAVQDLPVHVGEEGLGGVARVVEVQTGGRRWPCGS